MADDGGVGAALDSAKKALSAANNSSVGTKSGHSNFAHASYGMAHAASKSAGKAPESTMSQEAKSTAEGLAAKKQNVDSYASATGN